MGSAVRDGSPWWGFITDCASPDSASVRAADSSSSESKAAPKCPMAATVRFFGFSIMDSFMFTESRVM